MRIECVGWLPSWDIVHGLAVSSGHAYLANWWEGLRVIDVGDPTTPTEIGFFEIPGSTTVAVAVDDGHAYVAHYAGLEIVDVSVPSAPLGVGGLGGLGVSDVAVADGIAYLATWPHGLAVADVSNLAEPEIIGVWQDVWEHGGRGVRVSGDRVYLAEGAGGIAVFRVCTCLFTDDFESGDTNAWSAVSP